MTLKQLYGICWKRKMTETEKRRRRPAGFKTCWAAPLCIFIDDRGLQSTNDTASCARVYQTVVTADKRRRSQRVEHDVRAKQTKVCDAELAGFHTPIFILVTSRQRRVITHASNYLQTDGQLIVQGRTACSIPSLTASLAAVFSARR